MLQQGSGNTGPATMTAGLTRMSAPKDARLTPLLPVTYRNVESRKNRGAEGTWRATPSQGQQSQRPAASPSRAAQSQGGGSQSHRHHLLLNCTFTFTQTISKSWNKCRVRGGRNRCLSEARTPSGLPQARAGSIRLSVSGHQFSTGTRTASQQLLTHKYRHA